MTRATHAPSQRSRELLAAECAGSSFPATAVKPATRAIEAAIAAERSATPLTPSDAGST
jgi:hypothetical protein